MLTSLSVDEILFPMYGIWSTNLIGLSFKVAIVEKVSFICLFVEANSSCCLLYIMQLGFGLGWCIFKKHKIICEVCFCHGFCVISSALFHFNLKPFYFITSIDVRSTSIKAYKNTWRYCILYKTSVTMSK